MASIRGTSRGSHPSLPPLLIPQEETLAPSRGPPIESREAMAGWRSSPRSGRGWPLCQEPLSQKRGVHPSPRALVVRAGPSLFPWTPGTLFRAGLGSHSSQALTCPTHPLGLGWDYLAGPQPHPYPCWQGQGSQLAFPASSILRVTYNCRAPPQGCSAGLDGAHWSKPLETDTSGQVWPLAPPQAGGSRLGPNLQDHIALIDLPLIPLLCWGEVGSRHGLCTHEALRAP